jgi:peptidoglycan/xylan/chitin deacetylase (PgdA/CDA1 family)
VSRATQFAAWAGGAVGAAAFAHLVPGVVAWRSARSRFLPGLSGVGRADHVALTFDDGPHPESTPAILDALDDLGWNATFFLLGSEARSAPGLVGEIAARGHEIGVHGEVHRSHLLRTAPAVSADVAEARALLEELSGQRITWFRPPYGGVAASTLVAAHRDHLRLVLWTTWGLDWKADATGETIAANCRRTFVTGATVLLHDSDVTSTPGSWKATLASLPVLADEWTARGLAVGPLRDHF